MRTTIAVWRPGLLFKMKLTLLIVDDNAGIRRVLRRILSETTSIIWECSNGADALSAYEQHHPDVVLMDIHMHGMDGLAATRQLRIYDPRARVIIVTDYQDDDMKAAALDAGAHDYVSKQEMTMLPERLLSLARRDDTC